MSVEPVGATAKLRAILEAHELGPDALFPNGEETPEQLEIRLARLDPVITDFVSAAVRSELQVRARLLDVQAQILDLWGDVFDLLDAVRILSADLGREAEALVAEWVRGRLPPKREALGRLFHGAHLVSSEVSTLLRHGYAAGALARWRAIYEMGIRAAVIDIGGDELAERFLDHERVRHFREERRWWAEVDHSALPDDELNAWQRLDEWEKELIASRGGAIFMREYGWAHSHLHDHNSSYRKAFEKERRQSGPSLTDLSRSVEGYPDKSAREIYYSRASAAIHGSPRSLGDFDEVTELNIWGGPTPNYLGLAVDQTVEDLAQLTYTYVGPLEEANAVDAIMLAGCLANLTKRCQALALTVQNRMKGT